jgi:hypothetical protein
VTNALKCPWTVDPSNTILWWPHWLMYVNTILSFVHRLTFCVGSYSAMKKIDVAFLLLCNIIIKIVLWSFFNIYAIIYYVYFIITVNTYLFKYVPVKLGFYNFIHNWSAPNSGGILPVQRQRQRHWKFQ